MFKGYGEKKHVYRVFSLERRERYLPMDRTSLTTSLATESTLGKYPNGACGGTDVISFWMEEDQGKNAVWKVERTCASSPSGGWGEALAPQGSPKPLGDWAEVKDSNHIQAECSPNHRWELTDLVPLCVKDIIMKFL